MAHTKAKGTSKLGRDSISKRLGLKVTAGEKVWPGRILVRQRGTRYLTGEGTGLGKDDTIFAEMVGKVVFKEKVKKGLGGRKKVKEVRVV